MRPALPACLLLAACAAAPAGQTREADLEQLTIQATTLEEAEAYLGPPLHQQVTQEGAVAVEYAMGDAWDRGGTVFLFFNPSHVLIGKAYVEDDDVDEVRT